MALVVNGVIYPDVLVLGKSGVAAVCPLDTNEDTLATVVVPANIMGPNGVLRVSCAFTYSNTANQKTMRIRYSGSEAFKVIRTNQINSSIDFLMFNRGLTNSQSVQGNERNGAGTLNSQVAAMAVDTTPAASLVISGQKQTAGEALTLESYLVELIQS